MHPPYRHFLVFWQSPYLPHRGTTLPQPPASPLIKPTPFSQTGCIQCSLSVPVSFIFGKQQHRTLSAKRSLIILKNAGFCFQQLLCRLQQTLKVNDFILHKHHAALWELRNPLRQRPSSAASLSSLPSSSSSPQITGTIANRSQTSTQRTAYGGHRELEASFLQSDQIKA